MFLYFHIAFTFAYMILDKVLGMEPSSDIMEPMFRIVVVSEWANCSTIGGCLKEVLMNDKNVQVMNKWF